nr:hypothetical protein [Tanacetum cinerariifolium]
MNVVQLKTTTFLHLVGKTKKCIMVNLKKFSSLLDDDDNFINDEDDDVPHDLADYDDEVLANVDDDDEVVTVVYSVNKKD